MTAPRYLFDPLGPFPKRWKDHVGPINVMGNPHKNWLMVRRPGAMPFCLNVSDLCNTTRRSPHGPFTVVGEKTMEVEVVEVTTGKKHDVTRIGGGT